MNTLFFAQVMCPMMMLIGLSMTYHHAIIENFSHDITTTENKSSKSTSVCSIVIGMLINTFAPPSVTYADYLTSILGFIFFITGMFRLLYPQLWNRYIKLVGMTNYIRLSGCCLMIYSMLFSFAIIYS